MQYNGFDSRIEWLRGGKITVVRLPFQEENPCLIWLLLEMDSHWIGKCENVKEGIMPPGTNEYVLQ